MTICVVFSFLAGYGNLAPSTVSGQVFCVFYALFGVPLNLAFLNQLGKGLSAHLINMEGWVHKPSRVQFLICQHYVFIVFFKCDFQKSAKSRQMILRLTTSHVAVAFSLKAKRTGDYGRTTLLLPVLSPPHPPRLRWLLPIPEVLLATRVH